MSRTLRAVVLLVVTLATLAGTGVASADKGGVPNGGGRSSCNDSFNAPKFNPSRWTIGTVNDMTVEAKNGRAEIELVGPGFGGGGLRNQCVIAGDFDVQVAYALLEWPETGAYSMRLGAYGLGEGPGGGIGVVRFGGSNGLYLLAAQDSAPAIETSDLEGTIRLVRSGSVLSGYAASPSGWQLIGTGSVSTSETYFALDVGSSDSNAPGGALGGFDNFAISSGTVVR